LSKSETDWARLDAMTDADIDLSDCPEVTSEMFAGAVVRRSVGNRSRSVRSVIEGDSNYRFRKRTLRERDVLEWFQAQGDRADLQMALALKIYAEANKAYALDR
jgi:uncharacterized protein (DUF4415 family)